MIRELLRRWRQGKSVAHKPRMQARPLDFSGGNKRKRFEVTHADVARAAHPMNVGALEAFSIPQPWRGVVPAVKVTQGALPILAMDDMTALSNDFSAMAYGDYFKEGLGFLGYAYLAELAQRGEYRRAVEIIGKEMTRKWVKFTVAKTPDGEESDDAAKADRVNELEEAIKGFRVKELMRVVAEKDGYFGRHQLYVDTGDTANQAELTTPLLLDPRKLEPGFLKGFRSVEAIWSYPAAFNSVDPLQEDYYKPPFWYVQAKAVHSTRLLTFVSRPMPDILKPAYCFGGLALTQIMKPYVDNWLQTRQSVNDLIQMYSTGVLKTDMAQVMEGGGADSLFRRVDFFNRTRTNRGTFVINTDEEFTNVSASLASLDKLQAQAQEHMAAITGIPLVVLLGVTPSGLNASSDGEIRVFYSWIKDQQEHLFREPLTAMIRMIMLHLWGEVDTSIDFDFVPLWEDDAKTLAEVEKTKADTAAAYISAGVIAPEEERERITNDDASMYQGVDLSAPPPEPPADPAAEGDPDGDPDPDGGGGKEADPFAHDAWNEDDHPRADNGQFGSGGSSARFDKMAAATGAKKAHAMFAKAQGQIPAKHFSAASYAAEHDRADVTPESVLLGFPPTTGAMLRKTAARVHERGQTIDKHRMSGHGSEAIYTPERDATHRDLLAKPFTDPSGKVHPAIINPEKIAAATPAPGERPKFMMLGGRGGSGKSKFEGLVYDPSKYLVLDADEIKQRLPEYEGWNANEVHEESSDILEGLLDYARAKGLNVVLDATLKSLPGALKKLEAFKSAGYETEAHYMHLPREEAAKRAIGRYLTEKNDGSGRFVPPHVVLSNTANEANFDAVRQHVDRWSFHDNHNVDKKDPPRMISRGAKAG